MSVVFEGFHTWQMINLLRAISRLPVIHKENEKHVTTHSYILQRLDN